MSNTTIDEKVVLGEKVQFTEMLKPHSNTAVKTDKTSPSISIICKSKNAADTTGTFYIRVDFKSNKKKETYRKINKILGDR